ncbi:ROK family protein [Pseudactinotalea sp. Z1739]|uniref:ROK family transcriptional regulator n=1 Tax=Pseudactinotalea sp. Z1739 TaxID=3413028 RepID=UPI003C7C5539
MRVTNRIVELVSTGEAASRADLARALHVSPSTISLHVQQLLDDDVLYEHSQGASRGGRRPRVLRLRDEAGYVGVAELGSHHARLGIIGISGDVRQVQDLTIAAAEGPEPTLERLATALAELGAGEPGRLRAVALAVAAPVDFTRGTVIQASRLASWNLFPVAEFLHERLGVAVVIENDANAMALGEHLTRAADYDSVTVKAGTAIGSGLIIGGQVYRGSTFGAGDITHTRVPSAGDAPCSCGNLGCLETVASGAGIVRLLQEQGAQVAGTQEMVAQAAQGLPTATSLVRAAGGYLGEVLATVVNFVNPGAVYLGGVLSTVEPFVAAVRSRLYEGCHPLVTRHLLIEPTLSGADAGVIGAGRLALSAVFSHHIDEGKS